VLLSSIVIGAICDCDCEK